MERPTEVASEKPGSPSPATVRQWIDVRPGVSFAVAIDSPQNDPITLALARGVLPGFCRPLVELIEAFVPVGGRILDLGSHVGTFALAASASGRRVVAVEALPQNVSLIGLSRRANRFADLRIVHAALGEETQVVRFYGYGPFGVVDRDGGHDESVAVPGVAGDDLLDRMEWDRVDFIKMDIEGSEIDGLLGLAGLLRRPDAPPIYVESNGHTLDLFGETPASLKAVLAAYGYRLYQVEGRRLIPVAIDEYQGTTVVDYLAVKSVLRSTTSWRVDPPMSPRERIRRARATLLSPIDHDRAYAARTIGHAPESIRTDRRVVRAVEALKADPVASIRRAASAWSFTPGREPWYAPWRR